MTLLVLYILSAIGGLCLWGWLAYYEWKKGVSFTVGDIFAYLLCSLCPYLNSLLIVIFAIEGIRQFLIDLPELMDKELIKGKRDD